MKAFIAIDIILIITLNFLVISALVAIICWGLDYPFSWALVVALWAAFTLIRMFFRRH